VREVFIAAGEPSADLIGAALVERLAALRPDLRFAGIGGPRMAARGVELVARSEALAVMGFVEVLRHLPRHAALLSRVDARLARGNTGVVIPIDYPGFNMKLAARAKARGIPVLYYVTPQVWAWGAKRLPELARLVTKAAPILPFEEPLLRRHGIDATFVGHPLLERARDLPDRAAARAALDLPSDATVIAIFPGSRAQEITRHRDIVHGVVQALRARQPAVRVVIGVAPTVSLDAAAWPAPLVAAPSFTLFRAADAALVKSGTTTLEAAVSGCPLAVFYRTNAVTYRIARRVVRIPHIGLVNVVAERGVAPEFVQRDIVPARIAETLLDLAAPDSAARGAQLAGLAEVAARLGTPGASARVAAFASELMP
jgi:lipid-A-disaccharide synthase